LPEHRLIHWRWRSTLANATVFALTAVVVAILAWLVIDLLRSAWPRLSWNLLTEDPRRAGRAGGLAPILVATAGVLTVCLAVVVPLGLATAIALAEARGRWANMVRASLDVLAGAPSIVVGLFGLLIFGDALGLGYSLASGGLTLAMMVLPVVVRLGEAALRAVPAELPATAAALGLSRTSCWLRLIIPTALPGLLAALALGVGRALAETAALLFTAGASERMPESLADPGRVLAVHIYELAMNVAGGEASAAASAVVLLAILTASQALGLAAIARSRRSRPS